MKKVFITKNHSQTKKLGGFLAESLLRTNNNKKALILSLEGDLGGGKTTFLQGFAKKIGIKERVLSPTFIIVRKSKIKNKKSKFKTFYHFDCYRISKLKDILNLGIKKLINDPENIIVIEWANLIKKSLPRGIIKISFIFLDKTKRRIIINK